MKAKGVVKKVKERKKGVGLLIKKTNSDKEKWFGYFGPKKSIPNQGDQVKFTYKVNNKNGRKFLNIQKFLSVDEDDEISRMNRAVALKAAARIVATNPDITEPVSATKSIADQFFEYLQGGD